MILIRDQAVPCGAFSVAARAVVGLLAGVRVGQVVLDVCAPCVAGRVLGAGQPTAAGAQLALVAGPVAEDLFDRWREEDEPWEPQELLDDLEGMLNCEYPYPGLVSTRLSELSEPADAGDQTTLPPGTVRSLAELSEELIRTGTHYLVPIDFDDDDVGRFIDEARRDLDETPPRWPGLLPEAALVTERVYPSELAELSERAKELEDYARRCLLLNWAGLQRLADALYRLDCKRFAQAPGGPTTVNLSGRRACRLVGNLAPVPAPIPIRPQARRHRNHK